jgi:hypothetical protein
VLEVTASPTRSIPILLYHSVSGATSSEAAPFVVAPDESDESVGSSPTSASRATRPPPSRSSSGSWGSGRRCPSAWSC